ncbi:unnamed protein product [Didymodactylos carnosus]|uniref:Uncharacterized protein n=1 Tax=Didymodactylos carnosus TaxID=1234261 RepID=A0A815X0X7_9BILA|nr:unnamed protein product [Didymodactylos carnosus]CAF1552649.1 unnamed protein product [Didymodactylos carnosus]CAF4167802.1 unnamed protein product [Didymodactylos carnosus]CAF4413740.1 unnamed protein product [Didymodactylos carnosus]
MTFEPKVLELSSISIQHSTNNVPPTSNPRIEKENYLDQLCVNQLNFIKEDSLLTDKIATFNCIFQSPYEVVNTSVPIITDDKMPYLTFRTLFMGLLLTVIVSILSATFSFRRYPLNTDVVIFQLISMPLGQLMARLLPKKTFHLYKWKFSLNNGPFNIKEHSLITAMLIANADTAYAIYQITALQIFFEEPISFAAGLFFVISSRMIGFGMAGE